MTACNDVQDMNLGKKAVSATLVGALAVGMVPGVALAANATDESAADDGINALALTPAQAFAAGKVTGVTVDGKAVLSTTLAQWAWLQLPQRMLFRPLL